MSSAVLMFAAHYDAEMGKLPHDASEAAREAAHRTLLGVTDAGPDVALPDAYVDVFALLEAAS